MDDFDPLVRSLTNLRPTSWHQPSLSHLRNQVRSLVTPYLELARVNKPAGVLAIYPPYLLGALIASVTISSSQDHDSNPLSSPVTLHLLILTSAFLLRSAGCAWNDVVDRDIDRRVARSRSRPMARGALSVRAGTVFAATLILTWLAVVGLTHARALLPAVANVPGVLLYPYAKRFTDFPQLVLGVTLAWGIGTGFVMGGGTMTADPPIGGTASLWWSSHEPSGVRIALAAIAAAWTVFTVFYDTIYAYQDLADDRRVGVRSTAVRFGDWGKHALVTAVFVQAALMIGAGWQVRWGAWYAAGCVCAAVIQLVVVRRVDLRDPKSCGSWFKKSLLIVSAVMALSIALARVG